MPGKLTMRVVRGDNTRRVSVYLRSDGHYEYEEDVISEWDDTPPHWTGQGASGIFPSAKAAMAEAKQAMTWIRYPSETDSRTEDIIVPAKRWRPIGVAERALVMRLLACAFQGRGEVLEQVKSLEAMRIDGGYSLKLRSQRPPAKVKNRGASSQMSNDNIVIEGFYDDVINENKGIIRVAALVRLALHVTDGRLSQLEIYKENGKPILIDPYEIDLSRVHFY